VQRDFRQNIWDDSLEENLQCFLENAVWEDLGELGDLTSLALIPNGIRGRASICVRHSGIVAGLPAIPLCLSKFDPELKWFSNFKDSQYVEAGTKLGEIVGPALGMMAAERLLLNLLGHLCGVATLTWRFVDAIQGTKARIYDTRKTTPGWRKLEKYAVRCGGGFNHRAGLYDAVLIKDNHLAFGTLPGNVLDSEHGGFVGSEQAQSGHSDHRITAFSLAESVQRARLYLTNLLSEQQNLEQGAPFSEGQIPIIEIEVDSLVGFEELLAARPDIVLLDNMSPEQMEKAVQIRDKLASETELEASGGITLESVRAVAESGVERISVGSLTHSSHSLDVGLDWEG